MQAQKFSDDVETQANAFGLAIGAVGGAIEPLKNVGQRILWDADTLISDAHFDGAPRRIIFGWNVPHGDRYTSPARAVF